MVGAAMELPHAENCCLLDGGSAQKNSGLW